MLRYFNRKQIKYPLEVTSLQEKNTSKRNKISKTNTRRGVMQIGIGIPETIIL